MRILSQDGMHEGIIDVPYEQVSIEQKENEIWCGYSSTMDRNCIGKCFAKYSTSEKAIKVMEMLRNFNEVREVKNIPIKKDVIETMFEPLKKLFKIYTDGGGEFLKMDLVKIGDYFQFPSDDEVEV